MKIISKIRTLNELVIMGLAKAASLFVRDNNIWLVAEKTNEARDNGYWFYKYLKTHHPEEKSYYVISKGVSDYSKIEVFGSKWVVKPKSLKHRILFWSAKYNVSSQPPADYFSSYRRLMRFRSKQQISVFLQHGVIKDNLSHWLDADKSGIDVFITSAKREQESVIERHHYTENSCALVGLCRFDNLTSHCSSTDKTILVMPTFRHWLMTSSPDMVASFEELERFKNDPYCAVYKSLLYSDTMGSLLNKYGYKVIFYPHYCAQPFLSCFEDKEVHDNIIVASSREYDVQKLLQDADVLITDFSSVFFDFAYMKKPEIFYQFDEDKYRKNHYEEGYFRYTDDAFGPIFKEEADVFDYLERILDNNAKMETKYLDRVDEFFAYADNQNCSRTYNFILNYKQ